LTDSNDETEYELMLETSQNIINKSSKKTIKKLESNSKIIFIEEKVAINKEKIKKLKIELKKLYSNYIS
jgi:hypothetical protein